MEYWSIGVLECWSVGVRVQGRGPVSVRSSVFILIPGHDRVGEGFTPSRIRRLL